MIDASTAVKSAAQFWRRLLEDPALGEALPDPRFRVEEVERADNYWTVTLSVNRVRENAVPVHNAAQPREYKHFEVEGETAEVKSMRIGSLNPVGQ